MRVLPNPGLAARRLKANSQETSVGRKGKVALFRSLATGGGGVGVDTCPKADCPPDNQGTRAFIDREGATCRNNTVSSDSHLEIGHQWSDQRHLDCFRYS